MKHGDHDNADNAGRTVWTSEAREIFRLLADQPVAYRANLALAFEGDPITALVLAQSFYFDSEARARGMAWWSKTDVEFAARLGINVKRFRRGMDLLTDEGMALLRYRARRYQATDYQVDYARCHAYIAGKAHLWMPAQGELPLPEMDIGSLPKMGNEHYPKWVMTTTQNGQSKEIKEIKEEKSVGGAARDDRTHPAVLAFFEATGGRFWPQAGLIPIIVAKVGDDPQRVDLWKRINIARLARGEMLMNIDKSLAWLEAGKVPDGAKINGNAGKPSAARQGAGRSGNARSGGRSHQLPQVEYTDESRAAARERARTILAERQRRLNGDG